MVQGVEIVSRSDGSSAIVDRSPLTNEILAHVPCSSAADVDTSVQAASVAQEEWGLIPLHDRVQILKDALAQALAHAAEADVVERFAKDSCTTAGDGDLAALITHEMGKVLSEAQGERHTFFNEITPISTLSLGHLHTTHLLAIFPHYLCHDCICHSVRRCVVRCARDAKSSAKM